MNDSCHCGLGNPFSDCCEPIINGVGDAKTAEQLMRARYSAYVTAAIDFLESSLHANHRHDFDFEATQKWAESAEWKELIIHDTSKGTADDKTGTVSFTAAYTDADGNTHQHSERSHFKKSGGKWFFCDGHAIAPNKVGRNDPCICGSGKKYKKCCAA